MEGSSLQVQKHENQGNGATAPDPCPNAKGRHVNRSCKQESTHAPAQGRRVAGCPPTPAQGRRVEGCPPTPAQGGYVGGCPLTPAQGGCITEGWVCDRIPSDPSSRQSSGVICMFLRPRLTLSVKNFCFWASSSPPKNSSGFSYSQHHPHLDFFKTWSLAVHSLKCALPF